MKNFDAMKPDDFDDIERQLGEVAWNDPTPQWRSAILASCKPPVPWLPKPLLIGLGACWLATAGFMVATPKHASESRPSSGELKHFSYPPLRLPDDVMERDLLGYFQTSELR